MIALNAGVLGILSGFTKSTYCSIPPSPSMGLLLEPPAPVKDARDTLRMDTGLLVVSILQPLVAGMLNFPVLWIRRDIGRRSLYGNDTVSEHTMP